MTPCRRKVRYAGREDAERAARRVRIAMDDSRYAAAFCAECGGYHVVAIAGRPS